jgi:hypothetical protein
MVMASAASPTIGAAPTACRVRNTASDQVSTRLQSAVDAARDDERLTVRGTCTGATVIDKDMVIKGISTSGEPATLQGGGRGKIRVLRVVAGVTVRVDAVRIRRGDHRRGAGIQNLGSLTLHDVFLWRNIDYDGGTAIWNGGTLSLRGDTTIRDPGLCCGPPGAVYRSLENFGTVTMDGSSSIDDSAAVTNRGTLTMNGSSTIVGHDFPGGGGVLNDGALTMNDASRVVGIGLFGSGVRNGGSLTMNGSSSIVNNGFYGASGGGVYNDGTLTMNDSSSIRDNNSGRTYKFVGTPHGRGGGVYNRGTVTMNGSSTITGNSVFQGIATLPPGLGGGLYNASGGILVGVNCAPHTLANVYGNTPDDCYFE